MTGITGFEASLDNDSIARYSRQLILPEIGVAGQLKLQSSSVLIVGAGGLGCPAALYLSAAGIGTLGIVDYDQVELSNLHRQILHKEEAIGLPKCNSATSACSQLNSRVKLVPYKVQLTSENAMQIIRQYDVVLDATDNVASRYLLNDACVLGKKPLVSGSALRFEGQLTIYNFKDGPCYRCLYPTPPPPDTVTNCSDGGVMGVVPGIIGSLQALEAIKILTNIGSTYTGRLLLFDGLDTNFHQIKLRSRKTDCLVCGDQPTIKELIDYEQFCGSSATDKIKNVHILSADQRLSCKEYCALVSKKVSHILLDVRQPTEVDICSLPSTSLNIPIDSLSNQSNIEVLKAAIRELQDKVYTQTSKVLVVVVCHNGNDSQRAASILMNSLQDCANIKDIEGGVDMWARTVDSTFPRY